MKTHILLLALFVSTTAHAVTIARWTFESSVPTTAGPIAAEEGTGTAVGVHASSLTAWSNPVGNGSAESWSADRWAVGDYFQFRISAAGFSALTVSFDQTSSGTGPRDFRIAYSLNGSSFSDFANYTVLENAASPNGMWSSATHRPAYSFSFNLSSVLTLNNAPDVYFRLIDTAAVSTSGGTVGTSGASRIDNVTVSGTAVPESGPGLWSWAVIGGLLAFGWRIRRQSSCPSSVVHARASKSSRSRRP